MSTSVRAKPITVTKMRYVRTPRGPLHLTSVRHWFRRNGLICNTQKTETMVIASQNALKTTRDINIFYENSILKQQKHFKYLGVHESLSWNNHVSYVASRALPSYLHFFCSFILGRRIVKVFFKPVLSHLSITFSSFIFHP